MTRTDFWQQWPQQKWCEMYADSLQSVRVKFRKHDPENTVWGVRFFSKSLAATKLQMKCSFNNRRYSHAIKAKSHFKKKWRLYTHAEHVCPVPVNPLAGDERCWGRKPCRKSKYFWVLVGVECGFMSASLKNANKILRSMPITGSICVTMTDFLLKPLLFEKTKEKYAHLYNNNNVDT